LLGPVARRRGGAARCFLAWFASSRLLRWS